MTAETAYVATLNALAALAGLSGQFQFDSDDLVFINGDEERFVSQFAIIVFPSVLILTVEAVSATQPFTYTASFPNSSYHPHIVSWGATAGDDELKVGGGTYTVVSKIFTTSGTKTVRIFHRNDYTEWSSTRPAGVAAYITDMAGAISNKLHLFSVTRGNFSALASLDLAFLAPAKDTLHYIIIEDSQLVGITAGWAQSLVAGLYKPYINLDYMAITGNTLTSAFVDAIINEYHDGVDWQPANQLYLSGNTPTAAPTGTSATKKAALIAGLVGIGTD